MKEMVGDLRGVGLVKLSELYKMIEVLLARHVLPEMQSCLGVSKLGEQVVEKRHFARWGSQKSSKHN